MSGGLPAASIVLSRAGSAARSLMWMPGFFFSKSAICSLVRSWVPTMTVRGDWPEEEPEAPAVHPASSGTAARTAIAASAPRLVFLADDFIVLPLVVELTLAAQALCLTVVGPYVRVERESRFVRTKGASADCAGRRSLASTDGQSGDAHPRKSPGRRRRPPA